MIWLIHNFLNYGYYVEVENISKISNNGKINWKQTIKNNSILFNNKNIIYKNFVRDKKIIDDSQILTQIYKACLSFSVGKIGFIFGLDETEKSVFDIENDKSYLIYYLSNELNNTFKDNKKELIRHLISIVTNNNTTGSSQGYSIYDEKFHFVFEFLVNKIFGTENPKDYFNTYSYSINNESIESSKLRPDTILKDEKNKIFYIIDSKYYNYGYSKNAKNDLPPSSDISKQIGYTYFFRDDNTNNKEYKAKSIFVLPYASKVKDTYIEYVGVAKRDNNENKEDEIAIFLVDLRALIDTYLKESKKLSVQYLLNKIQSIVS